MSETRLRPGAHKYGPPDVGCFGDASFGHDHIRGCLRTLLQHKFETDCLEANEIRGRLHEEMSDDASEEDDAINLLNDYACEGVYFEFVDGDLMLSVESSDNDD